MRAKKKLLKHVNYVFAECRGYIESKNNDCLNCLEGADTCYQVHEELKRLIQQQPEVDEKYVEERAEKLYRKLYGHWNESSKYDGNFLRIRDFITQILTDTQGMQVEVDEAFVSEWGTRMTLRGFSSKKSSRDLIRDMLKKAGVKLKK